MIANKAPTVKRQVIIWGYFFGYSIIYPSSLSLIFRFKKMTQDVRAFPFTGMSGAHIFFFQCSLILALNILFSNQPTSLISAKCFNIMEEVFCMR